ncbi:hypothetical protein ABZW96_33425 [Nocardia sp. NPDC004168]|uniref:hypothetical protein n=1 Tax=unclassified Nocardia TaxID=2637762 RepID=UPI00135AABE4|nr:hypothetical protein [Nocardia sp. CY41]
MQDPTNIELTPEILERNRKLVAQAPAMIKRNRELIAQLLEVADLPPAPTGDDPAASARTRRSRVAAREQRTRADIVRSR